MENADLETVSADIAAEIQMRCDMDGAAVPDHLTDFVRTHTPPTSTPVGSSACLLAKSAVGIKTDFPGFIEPPLATSIEKSPKGARWIHEIKLDGYRVQVHIANGSVKVFTRRGTTIWPRTRSSASAITGKMSDEASKKQGLLRIWYC